MSEVKHTPGPKPLTRQERRTLERLQLKWGRKTITAEEKGYALALSNRAWASSEDGRAAIAKAEAAAELVAAHLAHREETLAAVVDALHSAEAALSDIGDADREPGDDVAWCEARAAQAIPEARAALALARKGDGNG